VGKVLKMQKYRRMGKLRIEISLFEVFKYFILIIIHLLYTHASGQQNQYDRAEKLFQQKKLDESLAILDKIIAEHQDFIPAYMRKAGILYNQGKISDAIAVLDHVINFFPESDPEAWFSRGYMHFEQKQYGEAVKDFQRFLTFSSNSEKRVSKALTFKDLATFRDSLIQNAVSFKVEKLSSSINSHHSEYSPSASIDGSLLVFTRRISDQEDLFMSEKSDSSGFSIAVPIGALNTIRNEGGHCISADGNLLLFTGCDRDPLFRGCDLYYSLRRDTGWTKPLNIGKTINTPAWESQPSLSADGKKLFFTSNRIEGFGGKDIWYTYKNDQGYWVAPVNAGPQINTAGDDETPFIHADGKTLYWRSNGRLGMGDFDIYFARWDELTQQWGMVTNMGYPVNTENNEGGLVVSLDGKRAYFATDRFSDTNAGKRNLDIYTFEMPDFAMPDPMTFIKLKVLDKNTRKPLKADVVVSELGNEAKKFNMATDNAGVILTGLKCHREYALHISCNGYIFYTKYIDLQEIRTYYAPLELKVELNPLENVDSEILKPVVLENIFFKSGSARLMEKSMVEIKQLYGLLHKEKQLKIRITGHTDDEGNTELNQKLSEDRAKAVHDELIRLGIESNRLEFEGKGETQPVSDNSSKEGRRKNRRTEFTIVRS